MGNDIEMVAVELMSGKDCVGGTLTRLYDGILNYFTLMRFKKAMIIVAYVTVEQGIRKLSKASVDRRYLTYQSKRIDIFEDR